MTSGDPSWSGTDLGPVTLEDSFMTYDGQPVMFSASTPYGRYVAVWVDEGETTLTYLFVKVTEAQVQALLDKAMSFEQVFRNPIDRALYVTVTDYATRPFVVHGEPVDLSDVPEDWFPKDEKYFHVDND